MSKANEAIGGNRHDAPEGRTSESTGKEGTDPGSKAERLLEQVLRERALLPVVQQLHHQTLRRLWDGELFYCVESTEGHWEEPDVDEAKCVVRNRLDPVRYPGSKALCFHPELVTFPMLNQEQKTLQVRNSWVPLHEMTRSPEQFDLLEMLERLFVEQDQFRPKLPNPTADRPAKSWLVEFANGNRATRVNIVVHPAVTIPDHRAVRNGWEEIYIVSQLRFKFGELNDERGADLI